MMQLENKWRKMLSKIQSVIAKCVVIFVVHVTVLFLISSIKNELNYYSISDDSFLNDMNFVVNYNLSQKV